MKYYFKIIKNGIENTSINEYLNTLAYFLHKDQREDTPFEIIEFAHKILNKYRNCMHCKNNGLGHNIIDHYGLDEDDNAKAALRKFVMAGDLDSIINAFHNCNIVNRDGFDIIFLYMESLLSVIIKEEEDKILSSLSDDEEENINLVLSSKDKYKWINKRHEEGDECQEKDNDTIIN